MFPALKVAIPRFHRQGPIARDLALEVIEGLVGDTYIYIHVYTYCE
jgi:hypothetical protein